jgi:hypothetical protein
VTEIFSQPDDAGPARASEAETSLWGRIGAQAADTLDPKDTLSGMWLARRAREANAAGTDQAVGAAGDLDVYSSEPLEQRQAVLDAKRAAIPDINQSDAKLLLKQEGLTEKDVHLGDQETHKLPVLKMQIDEAHTRRDRQAAIERGPQGFFPGALGLVTSLGVGMIDPVNVAAFSIPVIGEARMGKILASAGDSILARGAARFGQGAAQGAVGTAALQPADWWLHTRDGEDYTMAQAMESVVMGAGMGGAFHAIPGGVGDVLARRRGLPLAGSPQDLLLRGLMTGTHVRADQLAEEGVPLHEVPGIVPGISPEAAIAEPARSNEDIEGLIHQVEAQLLPAAPVHPADALADLPPAAREDAVHAAMADIISGRPTQAAEMLNIAADHDPRIAESLEAWHGSPHDFDRFDVGQIGTGEGAQSYGHGLYFAENEGVARDYRDKLSRENPPLSAKALADPELGPRIKEATADYERLNNELADALNSGDEARASEVQHELSGAHRYLDAVHREANEKYPPGAVYKVRITADRSKLLDWDKEIGDQPHLLKMLDDHPEMKQALEDALDDHMMSTDLDVYTGRELYHMLRRHASEGALPGDEGLGGDDNKEVGEFLKRAGLHGVQYLDQGSRAGNTVQLEQSIARAKRAIEDLKDDAERNRKNPAMLPAFFEHIEGRIREQQARIDQWSETLKQTKPSTRNYVVFDDKHIEITHKNGEPVKREDLKAEHEAKLAQDRADAEAASTKHIVAKKPTGRAAANPETWSLFEYLASRGGLKPDPELEAIFGNSRGPFVPGFGSLIRKGGMPLDEALRSAKDGRYLFDAADVTGAEGKLTPRDFLDKIDEENRKRKVYRVDHTPAPDRVINREEEAQHILDALHTEIEAATGQSAVHIDPDLEARVVEIVQKEGIHDVMEAYERAIMEDRERYDAAAEARRADERDRFIPGWDVQNDAGTASPRGEATEGVGGQARRAGPGEGGATGEQPRTSGAGDRAQAQAKLRSSPAEAAADPRWRELADTTPDYNDPEVLAESEAADHVPEPDSLAPERSLTALERAAADAEEVWRKLEPTLTEKERALVHDVMNQLKLDAETRSQIIADGAACLVGAVG